MNAPQLIFSQSDALLSTLGIGMLAVHGSTIIRASAIAGDMLERQSSLLVGRDVLQLFASEPREKLREWLADAYSDPIAAGCIEVRKAVGDQRSCRLAASALQGGSPHTRAIAVEMHVPRNSASIDNEVQELRRTLRELLDGNPVPTFLINTDHVIMHWNHACERIIGFRALDMVGTRRQWAPFYERPHVVLADLVVDNVPFDEAETLYADTSRLRRSTLIPNALESTGHFPGMGEGGRWLLSTAAPIRNAGGATIGAVQTLVDISELKNAEQALLNTQGELEELVKRRTTQLSAAKTALEEDVAKRELAEQALRARYAEMEELNIKLADANSKIQAAQNQLVQNEKLASIGQLAAGVAHEINNPIGYVFSNFGTLENYVADLFKLINAYHQAEATVSDPALRQRIEALRKQLDLEFLQEDTQALMRESREGIERVRKIVHDLKDFSHVDSDKDWQLADLQRGLESTLNIVNNEIKYHAEVIREYAPLPPVQCLPSQLNQVFMNLLVNAAHALDARSDGRIIVRTGHDELEAWVEIIDNGCGMSEETMNKIFDPFFTTKPIGRGTGLGLALSYGIVQKHHGRIEVDSRLGEGTRFRVVLPIVQPEEAPAPAAPESGATNPTAWEI
ncbi:ATP-binding protein [Uliginosibacterium sediminicola]|uniref:histidine kinase n=1 Tax=Uliginosibacterium sediminicola TaxID=2024550 RepID=A0ABU9YT64_9RHOO